MKNTVLILLFVSLLGCNDSTDTNQILPFKTVDFTVNLNLAEGLELNINGAQKAFANQGIGGVLIIRRTETVFDAYEMTCPHIELQDCSTMTFDSLFLTCPCDNERFQLIDDGIAENGNISHSLRNYSVIRNGNLLRITN